MNMAATPARVGVGKEAPTPTRKLNGKEMERRFWPLPDKPTGRCACCELGLFIGGHICFKAGK